MAILLHIGTLFHILYISPLF